MISFILRIVCLPIDLVMLTFHYIKGTIWLVLDTFQGLFELQRESAYPFGCFTEMTDDGENACLAGRKYANIELFGLLCPDPKRERGCKRCTSHCKMYLAETHDAWRPSWFRIILVGFFLLGIWSAPAYYLYINRTIIPKPLRQKAKAVLNPKPAEPVEKPISESAKNRSIGFLDNARALNAAGKYDEALLEFRNAIRVDPRNVDAQYELAQCLVTTKRYGLAWEAFQQTVALDEGKWEAHLEIARIGAAVGNIEAVLFHTKAIIDQNNEVVEAYLRRGIARHQQGEREGAIADRDQAQKMLATDPDVEMLVLLGTLSFRLGDSKVAAEITTRALALAPDSVDANLQKAQLQARDGEVDAAIAIIEAVIQRNPEEVRAKAAMAELEVSRGNIKAAIDIYEMAITGKAGMYDYKVRLSELWMVVGSADKGLQMLQAVEKEAPTNARCQFALARLYFERKLYSQTVEHLQKVIERIPGHVDAHRWLAEAYLAQNDDVRALDAINRAIELRPNALAQRLIAAKIAERQEKYDAAKAIYQKCLEIDPKAVVPLLKLGNIMERANERLRAAEYYKKVLALAPDNAVAANNLAMVYLDKGENLDEAFRLAEVAVKRSPKNAYFLDTYGWALFHKGEYKKARNIFVAALKLRPNGVEHAMHLVEALAKLEDWQNVAKLLEQLEARKADLRAVERARIQELREQVDAKQAQ